MPHSNSVVISRPRQGLVMMWAAVLILGSYLALVPRVHAEGRTQPWRLLDPDAKIPALSEGRSGLVFLKPQTDAPQPGPTGHDKTVSVFIDGTYHTSLPKASWAYAEVCPGAHLLIAVQDQAVLAITEEQPSGRQYQFAPASTSFFELHEDDQGAPQLEAIDPGVALAVLEQLPRAIHTVSRLQSKDCVPAVQQPPPPPSPPEPTVTSNYTLKASTFFDFDDSQLRANRDRGQSELDAVIQKVRDRYLTVRNIEVNGYTDPSGSAAYNLNLSRKRAETIAKYLARANFGSASITAKGMGATNLAVPDCAALLKTPQRIQACNEPNRRVELVIHGQPKNE